MEPAEIRPHLEALGGYDRPTIHIAGTKGKGTTTHLLALLLSRKGMTVGQFTSPHLLDDRECIQINGTMISETEWQRLRSQVSPELSSFEIKTIVALRYFQENGCDFVVLETGLGGRRDATNIVNSQVLTILTHIELEHTAFLGDTLEAITREKLGITRPGVPLLVADHQAEAVWREIEAWDLETERVPEMKLGFHHPEAVGLALRAAEFLGLPADESDLEALRQLSLMARFEIVPYGRHTLILDGAHTPDSVAFVKGHIEAYRVAHGFSHVAWVVHFLRDKHDSLRHLFPQDATTWIPIEDERAGANAAHYQESSPAQVLKDLDNETTPQLVAVVGSFKLVTEFKRALAA